MCTVHNQLNFKDFLKEKARIPKSRKIGGDPRMVSDLDYIIVFSLEKYDLLKGQIKKWALRPSLWRPQKKGPRKGGCKPLELGGNSALLWESKTGLLRD